MACCPGSEVVVRVFDPVDFIRKADGLIISKDNTV